MAYDEALAERVRDVLAPLADISERKMFGGVGFLAGGNMCCGVHGDELIVRLGEEETETALAEPHVRPFDMTGRPMTGWLFVGPDGIVTDEALTGWVMAGFAFASSLPPKRK